MLSLLLRLLGVVLALGTVVEGLQAASELGGLTDAAARAPVLPASAVSAGLLAAAALICFACASVLAAVRRIDEQTRDPYEDHPKMSPTLVREREG